MNRNDQSTPIINYVFDWSYVESQKFQTEIMAMHEACRPPVEFHKRVLGKQTYTWVGEFRFWVWEGDNWRVYCSNQKGVCFEVRIDMSKEQVREAWDDYRRKVGLLPNT